MASLVFLPGAAGARDRAEVHEKAFLTEYAGFMEGSLGLEPIEERLAAMAGEPDPKEARRPTQNLALLNLALRASGMAEVAHTVSPRELEGLPGRLEETDARNLVVAKAIGLNLL